MLEITHRRSSQSPQAKARLRRRHLLLLTLITLFVYIGALPGHFLWNDQKNIVQGDLRVTSTSDLTLLATYTLAPYQQRHDGGTRDLSGGSWTPVPVLANTLSWSLWHRCAICWHLESLLWHLLSVIAAYILGRELLHRRRNGNGLAFWAAAFFAAHSANVPAVAWLQARPELIGAALSMVSLAMFSRLPATTRVPKYHVARWIGGCALLALGAMLSDESSYVLPLLALTLASADAMQNRRGPLTGIPPARAKAIGILFLVLAAVLLYRDLAVHGGLQFAAKYPSDKVLVNLATGIRHFWSMISQAALPGEPILSDVWAISLHWTIGVTLALLGTLAFLGATLVGLRFGNPAAFGSTWFVLWTISGVGIFPVEHYNSALALYPATWGMTFALVYLASRAWRPIGRQLARGSEALFFLPLLLVMMTVSLASNTRWWDEQSLYEGEVAADPYYFEGRIQLAHHALGQNHAADALQDLQTALEAYRTGKYAGDLDKPELFRLMGIANIRLQLYDQAVESLKSALKLRPSSATDWQLLGLAQIGDNKAGQAVASLHKAEALKPHDFGIQADLGQALIANRDAKGIALLQAMLQHPGVGNFQRYAALGKALLARGDYRNASQRLLKALTYRDNPDVRATLALALWRLGERQQAVTQLRLAEQNKDVDPQHLQSVINQMRATEQAPASPHPAAKQAPSP